MLVEATSTEAVSQSCQICRHNHLKHITKSSHRKITFVFLWNIKLEHVTSTSGVAELRNIIIPLHQAMFRHLSREIAKCRYTQHIRHALEKLLFRFKFLCFCILRYVHPIAKKHLKKKEREKIQRTNILCNVQSEKVPSFISVTTNYYQLLSPPSRKLIQYGVAQNEIIIHQLYIPRFCRNTQRQKFLRDLILI